MKKRKKHGCMVTSTQRLLGQIGGGRRDVSSYSVPVLDMAGSLVGEYLADKLLTKLKRKKRQRGGGALARALYNMDLARGIRQLDSTVQTTNRMALGTLLGSLAATGAYKLYRRRQKQKGGGGGGAHGWDQLFAW